MTVAINPFEPQELGLLPRLILSRVRRYPATWRIQDWSDPWVPIPVRLVNLIPMALLRRAAPFTEQALLEAARRSTGLQDFGAEDFLPPLRLLLEDLKAGAARLSPMGWITVHSIFRQQLRARLTLEQFAQAHPEHALHPIQKPVIIAGLPRTGTTHLQNILSLVHELRYLPLWQTLDPIVPPGQSLKRLRAYHQRRMALSSYLVPLLIRMHEMETDAPHEELTITALSFRSFFFEGLLQAPRYRAWYAEQDHTVGYEYLKRTLQLIQLQPAPVPKAESARWLLKSPQHVDQLDTIQKVFPDVKLIMTRRDPVPAVLSLITMLLYGTRLAWSPDRIKEEARAWVDRLEQMLRRSEEQLRRFPSGQVYYVHFDALMRAPEHEVRKIADFAELTLDKGSQEAISRHLSSHTRGRHGTIEYSFSELGLSEGEVRERFRFYSL